MTPLESELLKNLEFAVRLLKPIFGCTAQVQHLENVVAKANSHARCGYCEDPQRCAELGCWRASKTEMSE